MVDSAKICLTESRAKKNSSAEIEISWLLTEAVIDQVTANENAAAIHYDSAFSIISSEQPAFRITQKAYLQAFHFYRYYSLCGTGVNRSAEFVELCQNANNDSLLMLGLLQEMEMRECEGDTSKNKEIKSRIEQLLVKHPSFLGAYFDRLGVSESFFERWPQAIKYYLEAENRYLGRNDEEAISQLYMSMADVYDQLNDHRKAKKYLLRIKEFRYSKQDHLIDDYYNTLGWSPG